ncbi:FAD/NAD(P)-binding protein [Burkholderia thailandensis]|uniref:FAD-NAD(P)-binding family protein n=3 Tax=Burkholderia thailandensis TaxID=57975 RepID=A0AAW9CNX8_BURTH|nr:FAD/NAD(P)-binding protein [Burkholderia thailandensis]AHI66916.1 FAD-NAD(P)-binding family protein [Burkholderia thailandensis H0587]MCS3393119.1 FAD/NAD(P)-binding protein [Burkholderia thailandensis]MCS6429040.1 FAD/NAD(P)-binding protein [Burkholderia thailandensis]MCS6454525.1 FAD/NAD(P)-binding protein [Burkholderia thailandensis]MCS6468103.1 FAD/NAD(P)-binding protein [Burkholderia thailandensis]
MGAMVVAIIGMGPRGLTVLERLVSKGRRFPELQLEVHLLDPGMMGCGTHRVRQPEYLLLNTVCGLPTMFPPRSHAEDVHGESFLSWVHRRVAGIGPSEASYLPRALFGEYLRSSFERIRQQLPANVNIVEHACDAVAIWRDGPGECIACSDGTRVRARFVVLATGHTRNRTSSDDDVHDPYDFLENLDAISLDSNDAIGVAGFGLSSFDVLAGLTVGRGGRFHERPDGSIEYARSGLEPRIHMFSRSGLPYLARPRKDDGRFTYEPLLFTPDRVASIRRAQGDAGIDFLSDLMPLLSLELRAAYCRKRSDISGRPVSDSEWVQLRAGGKTEVAKWVEEVECALGGFDVSSFLGDGDLALDSGAVYQQRFVELLEEDLLECRLGLARSVRKYVAEVLLHLRESLNVAVDFGGLDSISHDYFFGRFASIVRRLSIGPQPERSEELVALVRAGVVSVELGPNPRVARRPDGTFQISSRQLAEPSTCVVGRMIYAQSPFPSIESSASPLLASLVYFGRLRKHRADAAFEGGVEINSVHHPIGRAGQVEQSIFVLGPLCEGSIYYNTYVPTTVGLSRPFVEAETVVGEILRDIGQEMLREDSNGEAGRLIVS